MDGTVVSLCGSSKNGLSSKNIRAASRPASGPEHAVPEFAAMTEDLDRGIGELISRLKTMDVLNNTYIIFLSDNGGRGDLPVAGKKDVASLPTNHPLSGSKHSIYEGGLRVPFAMIGPGIAADSISRVPVSGVDILPTLADLAGQKAPLDAGLDGGSLKPVVLDNSESLQRSRDFLVFHSEGRERAPQTGHVIRSEYKAALRQGDYKLVKFYGGPVDGQVELYNLSEDLEEAKNLANTQVQRTRELEARLDAYLNEVSGLTRASDTPKRKRNKKQ